MKLIRAIERFLLQLQKNRQHKKNMKLMPTLTSFLTNMVSAGVSGTRTLILLNLANHPAITLKELEIYLDKVDIDIPSMLIYLRKVGYIEVDGTPRKYRYSLTEKGETVCEKMLTLED